MLGLLLCSLVPLSVPRCRVRYETADGLRVLDGVRHGELLRTAVLRRPSGRGLGGACDAHRS